MASLFEVLQSFKDLDEDQRRRPTLQAVISTDQPTPAPPSFSLHNESETSNTTSSNKRHVLHGTSRMAFGNTSELSDMFRQKSNKKGLEVDDLHVESITLASQSGEGASGKSNTSSTNVKSGKQAAPPSTDAKLNSNFPNKKPSGNTGKLPITSKPGPTAGFGNKPIPGKPTPTSTPVSMNTQHGKATAMAKMAALGEEWPEEEELPGMSLPATSSLNKIGDLSKDNMKNMHNAVQRQKKVIIAKKKV